MVSDLEKYEATHRMKTARKKNNQGTKNGQDTEAYIDQLADGSSKENTLRFESRFESGNLFLALKVSDNEYNLLM